MDSCVGDKVHGIFARVVSSAPAASVERARLRLHARRRWCARPWMRSRRRRTSVGGALCPRVTQKVCEASILQLVRGMYESISARNSTIVGRRL